MNENLTFPLEIVIKDDNKVLYTICVPIVSSKKDLAMVIKKRLNEYFPEVFYVSWEKEDNSSYITYEQLNDYAEKYTSCLFIANVIDEFNPYINELVKNNKTGNYFLTFNDILIKSEILMSIVKDIDTSSFWPSFADLDIQYTYDTRKNYLTPSNSQLYSDILSQIKLDQKEDEKKLKGILNVYLDNKVKSLTELDMNKCLLRSPKFKNIIIDLLLNNKIRHYIYMIDGMGGIDSFKIIYDKVRENNKEIPYMVIIKETDDDITKSEKMRSLNETNSPVVLLTDIAFKNTNMPMNIDSVKIVNGGDEKIIDTIFNLSNAKYYTGIYPRKISIINYLSINTSGVKTLDQTNYYYFKANFITTEENFMRCRKNRKLIIENNKIMVRI